MYNIRWGYNIYENIDITKERKSKAAMFQWINHTFQYLITKTVGIH